MQDISSLLGMLPEELRPFFVIAAGIGFAIFLGRRAIDDGRKSRNRADVEVAGALIDKRQAEEIVGVINVNTEAMERHRRALAENTEAVGKLAAETDKLTDQTRRLGDHMIEANARRS